MDNNSKDDDLENWVRLRNDTLEIGGGYRRFQKNIFSNWINAELENEWNGSRKFRKMQISFGNIRIYMERISWKFKYIWIEFCENVDESDLYFCNIVDKCRVAFWITFGLIVDCTRRNEWVNNRRHF